MVRTTEDLTLVETPPEAVRPKAEPASERGSTTAKQGASRSAELAGRTARAVGPVLRSALGHRDGFAALVLALTLAFVVYEIAVLRKDSTTTFQAGTLAFIAVQLVIVACTVALAAHGVNPLAARFRQAHQYRDDRLANVDRLKALMERAEAEYQGLLDQVRAVQHEAVQHISVVAEHVGAVNEIWVDGVRWGLPEPTGEPIFGSATMPAAPRPENQSAFIREGWAEEVDGLPSTLDRQPKTGVTGPTGPTGPTGAVDR